MFTIKNEVCFPKICSQYAKREINNTYCLGSRVFSTCLTPSLQNGRFMSQARQMRHFAQSAKCETRGKEIIIFFSSPRLALRACFELRTKYRARLAWLIKHLLCRLLHPSLLGLRFTSPLDRFCP